MDKSLDLVNDIVPGRLNWRIRVRVVRMWEVPTFLKPNQANSLEMVLLDQMGVKIQAIVRKQLIYVFQKRLREGEVYNISYFSVAPSTGSYRAATHPYKIVFQMTTKVQSCTSATIPLYGLSFTSIVDVSNHTVEYDYLVDVMGLVTAVSEEREYVRDGSVTKMIIFEVTDHSGKIECALFGEYVALWNGFVSKGFEDKATLQNVKGTTRLIVNPDVPEVIAFKDRLIGLGIQVPPTLTVLGGPSKPSMEEEFLRMYPKKTISQLFNSEEDGFFVVSAIVSGFVEGEEWWYPACKCHRSVTADSGAYYCKGCDKHVIQMVPRYKIKLRVDDGTGDSVFVLFDSDVHYLLEKQCSVLVAKSKGDDVGFYPPEIVMLKGKRFLFKVDKPVISGGFFDGSYRVKRVCADSSIVAKFAMNGYNYTPTESIRKGKMVFDECSPSPLDGGGVSVGVADTDCNAASHVSLDGDFSLADADIASSNSEFSLSSPDALCTLGDDTTNSNTIGAEHLLAEFTGTPESEDDDESQAEIEELNYTKRNLDRVFDVVDAAEAEPSAKRRQPRK
ncbi:replication protein A 70 kDa DNA-binding subunit C [Medicago truncatula]|uniref:replication protein A 70 kDa DNA-binding subunit C n=1 Tax=Medicago truncatula TaxID=3880 RepID=UPI0002367BF8|nr:replication protein A 70 kDa DNA-binding subunit C [Medicago truncatula]